MVMPQTIEVASLGMWDSLILMVMALVVFGPRRLPEIGRQIGRLMYEIRKASNDFKFQMEDELRKAEDADRQKKEQERLAALALAAPAVVDSKLSNTGTGAPVADGQFPIPSPYPGEGVYPNTPPAVYEPQESYPRIQPSSTGEQVTAERPSRSSVAAEAPADSQPDAAATVREHERHG